MENHANSPSLADGDSLVYLSVNLYVVVTHLFVEKKVEKQHLNGPTSFFFAIFA